MGGCRMSAKCRSLRIRASANDFMQLSLDLASMIAALPGIARCPEIQAQKLAEPGVLGNGMTSRTFPSPVA